MQRSSRRTASVLASLAATLSLLAVPAGASAAFDFGKLKAWWPLAEGKGQTVYDWSGNRNHGMLGSTPGVDDNDPSWIKGIFWGNALRFDGNDFVRIPASNALEPENFTISLWTRAPESPGPFKYLLAKGSVNCVAASYAISTDSFGSLHFYVWDGADWVRSGGAPSAEIWDGRWHNIAATYDGTSAVMYMDGRNLGEPPGSPNPVDYELPDESTTLGGYLGSCELLFKGDLDQVMLFDKVLPVADIWARWGYILGKPTLG
jgi:hypothetical protein